MTTVMNIEALAKVLREHKQPTDSPRCNCGQVWSLRHQAEAVAWSWAFNLTLAEARAEVANAVNDWLGGTGPNMDPAELASLRAVVTPYLREKPKL